MTLKAWCRLTHLRVGLLLVSRTAGHALRLIESVVLWVRLPGAVVWRHRPFARRQSNPIIG